MQIKRARGGVHHAIVDTLEPVIPPALGFLQETDGRVGHRKVRVLVNPRPDHGFFRALEIFHQARYGILVRIAPTAHGVDRRLDRRIILTHRTMAPVVVARLVLQPGLGQQRHGVQTLLPQAFPAIADQQWIGHRCAEVEHGRRPAEVLHQQVATLVMDVIGITVIGGAQRDDRLQGFRLTRRHLQAVEAAPRDAHHSHVAVAPGLLAQPLDHFQRVILFLEQVLVGHQALGLAVAAHVHTNAHVTLTGHPRVGQRITHGRAVTLAIRQVLEDRRERLLTRRFGQPDARRQLSAIAQRDQAMLDFTNRVGKLGDDVHRRLQSNIQDFDREPMPPPNIGEAGAC